MYLVLRYLNCFSSAEEGTRRFTALDFSGNNVIVLGRVLYLQDIRYFVEAIIDEVKELLRAHLFFGLDVFDIDWSPGVVHDQPRNRSVGYSCFQDLSNSFHRHRFDLLRAILTHPSLRGRFHFVGPGGRIVWKAGPCFAYMATCHEVEMLLFCGTQTSVGEPGRGSEIASLLFSNVSGGTIRNLLVLFQYLCMMGTFNKTSHLIQRDLMMMRVPHPEIGRLWMLYLTFVRPTIATWQSYFNGQKAAARARHNLFFGPYRPVSSPELSRNLSRHTERLLKIKISLSLWRHLVTFFLNHHSVRFREYHMLLNRSGPVIQASHSDEAPAPNFCLPSGVNFHVFFDTMRTSGVWHDLVGFSRFSQPPLLEAMRCMPGQLDSVLPLVSPAADSVSASPSTKEIAEEVKRKVLPDVLQAFSQSRANDFAYLLESADVGLSSPPSRALIQPLAHLMHASRLRDLRTYLNDDRASFKDLQQALALELIRAKEPSLLVIGPTGMDLLGLALINLLITLFQGSGKTLPIFMSIRFYDEDVSTLFILPLAAMHKYKSRAKQSGISCKTWTSDFDFTAAPQLLLVDVEDCSWPDLHAHIQTLIRIGRLARIVVDQVHLFAKHESFKPSLKALSFLGSLPVSIVLVTATWPRSLEKELFEKLGRNVYQVLRRSTDRPKISQAIIPIQVPKGGFEKAVANRIVSVIGMSKDIDRALLFCNSRDECDRMAKRLGWRSYHSSLLSEERSEAMKSWQDGAVIGLVCTSMLGYCLNYRHIRYVFHLGPPKDLVDHYQAIDRTARAGGIGTFIIYFNPESLHQLTRDGDDPFGRRVINEMLNDTPVCRRLPPSFFMDGTGVPCAMIHGAQLCDVCAAEATCQDPDPNLRHIPHSFQRGFSRSDKLVESSTRSALLPSPLNQPAPSATFAHHLAAASASLAFGKSSIHAHELGHSIRIACDNLAKSCVNCWCNGSEYHSHSLAECRWWPAGLGWERWLLTLRIPTGCCFYCGCPQKVCFCHLSVIYAFFGSAPDDLCVKVRPAASCS